jgi:hypothetical protein
MNDIKSVVSVIKILERTIGILENCNDVGEISDSTRKRVIEMLNKATLEIYFLGNDSPGEQTPQDVLVPEKEQFIETPIEDVVEETDGILPDMETVTEKSVSETSYEEESIDIVSEEETLQEEEFIAEEEKTLAAKEIFTEEETLIEEEFVEEENVIEDEFEENTVSEDTIFNREDILSDKPLFEWEIDKSEPVQKSQENDINLLKLQLEEERKRLEQELQSWQDERRKRDEEILATKKLLESLQQQASLNQVQQQPVVQQPQPVVQQPQPVVQQPQPVVQQPQPVVQQPQPVVQQPQPVVQQPQPVVQQPQPVVQQPRPVIQQPQSVVRQSQPAVQANQPSQRVQQPQQSTTESHIRKEISKESTTQESLIDRFIGTKKVLHENFETDNMVNKISTPIASLPRAIGINDRFRFIKELFGGDSDLYNDTIKKLDTIGSLVSAISYIESNFSWDKNSDSVKQLVSLIRRRYM